MRRLALIGLIAMTANAQEYGRVQGAVRDATGGVLPMAQIRTQNDRTGAMRFTVSDGAGRYALGGLPPGQYRVTARKIGFRTVAHLDVAIAVGHEEQVDFVLDVIGRHEVVRVESGTEPLDAAAGGDLLIRHGGKGAPLPVNGSDLRVLFDLTPGVIPTPAAAGDAGQFSSNGQRPNTNSFRVDGVSSNAGAGGGGLPGSLPGSSLPAMSAIGSTEGLGSLEDVDSVELRSPNFEAAGGERPGADVAVTSRSGSNEFHGWASAHGRAPSWNAHDWFANAAGLSLGSSWYGDGGGGAGGPLRRDRTFFFASAGVVRLRDTGVQLTVVPTASARAAAPALFQDALSLLPVPGTREFGGGLADGVLYLARCARMETGSFRLDQTLGAAGVLFARVVRSPSSSQSEQLRSSDGDYGWLSVTAGATVASRGWIHEARFNFSRSTFSSEWGGEAASGGLADALVRRIRHVMPAPDGPSSEVFGIAIGGIGPLIAGIGGRNAQQQLEALDTIARRWRSHQFSAGFDYLRLAPSRDRTVEGITLSAASLGSLLLQRPLSVTATRLPQGSGGITAASLFAQDVWRPRPDLTFTFGLRWTLTPPVSHNGSILTSALWGGSAESPLMSVYSGYLDHWNWDMRYGQLAPRVGVAYALGSGFVMRAGTGVFLDAGLGSALNPFNGAPFNSWQFGAFTPAFPIAGMSGPAFDARPPDVGVLPSIQLPRSLEWRTSIERALGRGGQGSVAYVGSRGSHLLRREASVVPDTGLFRWVRSITEGASSYESLQLRYSGTIVQKLFGLAAYTWAHAIDDGSQDSAVLLARGSAGAGIDRGSSSFDVRHSVAAGLSYEFLRGWRLNPVVRAHTGFPIDVTARDRGLGVTAGNINRPDLVQGLPVWIADSTVPGGERLNPAAFRALTGGTQGSLGRNAIRGIGVLQFDLSAGREFRLSERFAIETGVSVFNVLNRPAFADPVSVMSSPWFGQSTAMQNLMFGGGSPNTGLTPLFQSGGPRSAELSVKFTF